MMVLRGATSQCQRSRCVSRATGPASGSAAQTRAMAGAAAPGNGLRDSSGAVVQSGAGQGWTVPSMAP